MRLRVEQHLDVANVEAEPRDAVHDQRRRAGVAAVDQDVPFRAGQQECGDVAGADVIKVAGDAERIGGGLAALFGRVMPEGHQDHERRHAESENHRQRDLFEGTGRLSLCHAKCSALGGRETIGR